MRTIGSVLDARGGISTGFDFLRVALSLSVLLAHSLSLVLEKESQPPAGLIYGSILPVFFALSGFLITGSALRLRFRDFIINRGLRIVPALFVEIFICALVIGSIFTSLPLKEYLTSDGLLDYFQNLTGFIHYTLPGVFTHNIYDDTVNRSLWTVPFEIGCYGIISFCILSGILRRRVIMLCIAALVALIIGSEIGAQVELATLLHLPQNMHRLVAIILDNYFFNGGRVLYVYFMAGCVFYLYRYEIPYSPTLFLICIFLFLFTTFQKFIVPSEQMLMIRIIALPMLLYIMAFIGVSDVPHLPLFHRGDYSYGIYLYGYPVQQGVIAATMPFMTISALPHFFISLLIVVPIAMASWHWIEKPILRTRKKFSLTAQKIRSHPQE